MIENFPENTVESDDEGFLSRWSRRKQQAIEEPSEAADEETSELAGQAAEQAPSEEVYQPTDEDMPPLESLNEDSDYSGFMSPKVSDGLRRLALRKLFHSSSFNIVDGLNDYDEDFTNFAKLGDIVTCDMKFQAEQEELKKAREAEQAGSEVSAEAETEVGHEEQEPQTVDEADAVQADAGEQAQGEQALAAADVEDDFDDLPDDTLNETLSEETDEEEIAG